MPGRDGMAPRRKLSWCETQRRESERADIHSQLRIDEDVERIATDRWCNDRGPRIAATEGLKVIGARANRPGDVVHARPQVIDEELEAVARQLGHPALEISAHRADVQKGRGEADADAAIAHRVTTNGIALPWRAMHDCARGDGGVTLLELPVVAALVREEEVAPAQSVEHLI